MRPVVKNKLPLFQKEKKGRERKIEKKKKKNFCFQKSSIELKKPTIGCDFTMLKNKQTKNPQKPTRFSKGNISSSFSPGSLTVFGSGLMGSALPQS